MSIQKTRILTIEWTTWEIRFGRICTDSTLGWRPVLRHRDTEGLLQRINGYMNRTNPTASSASSSASSAVVSGQGVGEAESGAADESGSVVTCWLRETNAISFSTYCIVAAFGTYFCMYAFRKPFTAGTYENLHAFDMAYKSVLISTQVAGYMFSKFIGIKVVSEMPPARRAFAILVLIAIAEVALIAFALIPYPYNWVALFFNGLPLGMVFGLVVSFLEGRRMTEILSAGLCASFIVASGVVKSVGLSLVQDWNISEFWMPAVTGMIFVIPLIVFVAMLSQIPRPSREDVDLRAERTVMSRATRNQFYWRHAFGFSGMLLVFLLLTVIRGIRDDFGVEIWRDLGYGEKPAIFTQSETLVMLGVVVINGLAFCVVDNRKAFLFSLLTCAAGFVLVLLAVAGYQLGWLAGFPMMVLVGLGFYVPYVAFHTTVFERMLAVFRDPGNLAFLMCVADAVGYLAYVGLLVVKDRISTEDDFLPPFLYATIVTTTICLVTSLGLVWYYARKTRAVTPLRGSKV